MKHTSSVNQLLAYRSLKHACVGDRHRPLFQARPKQQRHGEWMDAPKDMVTLSKRSTVLSMAAPRVESRARPPASPSVAEQSSVSRAAAGPCNARSPFEAVLLIQEAKPVGTAAGKHPESRVAGHCSARKGSDGHRNE